MDKGTISFDETAQTVTITLPLGEGKVSASGISSVLASFSAKHPAGFVVAANVYVPLDTPEAKAIRNARKADRLEARAAALRG